MPRILKPKAVLRLESCLGLQQETAPLSSDGRLALLVQRSGEQKIAGAIVPHQQSRSEEFIRSCDQAWLPWHVPKSYNGKCFVQCVSERQMCPGTKIAMLHAWFEATELCTGEASLAEPRKVSEFQRAQPKTIQDWQSFGPSLGQAHVCHDVGSQHLVEVGTSTRDYFS